MAFLLNRVLISDAVADACVNILQKSGIQVTKNTKLTKEQLIAEIPNYDGLIVRSATKVTADVIAAASRLKIIGRAGTGVDNIDIKAATERGVLVMNTPGGNTLSAAELTCTLILAMSRHVSNGTASLRAGQWEPKKFMGNEVYGKTLAIVGLGRIGREVATRMQSFGMRTIGYDPITPASESAKWDCQWMPLEELWPQADYITLHTPLIAATKHLVNDHTLSQCKRGVRLVNCARGGIIDEAALLRALDDGRCAGAALDVYEQEPPTTNGSMALLTHPLVTCTPHLGASTCEAQERVASEIAEQFVDLKDGRALVGAVNSSVMSEALSDDSRPWVRLATALGALAANLVTQPNSQVTVSASAAITPRAACLRAATLMGLLRDVTDTPLNLISVQGRAAQAGVQVEVQENVKEDDHYGDLKLEVACAGQSHMLRGAVIGRCPVLTWLGDTEFPSPAPLCGDLLLYKAQPFAYGTVMGALGTSELGVRAVSVGRAAGPDGWSVVRLDSAGPRVLQAVTPHVTRAFTLSLDV